MQNTENYSEAVKWLDALNQNKIVPGLERIRNLMKLFGNPHNQLRIITIGGTNAKGSTSYNLSNTLIQTGKKIGCFTSPHLHTVRERIKINNNNIEKQKFSEYLFDLKNKAAQNNIKITYFEALTALAYLYFNEEKVDYAIMEIGLGGEWDAVNVADADIAILTTLGLDHMEYLGNNLHEIASTKAKIVRKQSIVITGWEKEYHRHIPKSREFHEGKSVKEWIEICIKCLNLSIKPVIKEIPGRQESYLNFTLDTAHNEQAIEYLLNLNNHYKNIIIGMLKDKDILAFVSKLPLNSTILACNLKTDRSADSKDIYDLCKKRNIKCKQFENVKEAILSIKNEKTLITGSFYTVSEARTYFKLEGYSEL
tara:strand:- start:2245 stop:3345 length:1101 start_codon:yes stop_codon:yes gene_type:complete